MRLRIKILPADAMVKPEWAVMILHKDEAQMRTGILQWSFIHPLKWTDVQIVREDANDLEPNEG